MKITPKNILLIEDNRDHAELIFQELKNGGIGAKNISILKDGKEAWDYLFMNENAFDEGNPDWPDLIILDINLPKINGLEILKKIKSHPVLKVIPTIVLTASERTEDKRQSYQNGVNSFLTKSINFEKFINKIKELVSYWILTNDGPRP